MILGYTLTLTHYNLANKNLEWCPSLFVIRLYLYNTFSKTKNAISTIEMIYWT